MLERSELKKHSTRNVILRVDYIPITDENTDIIKSIFAEKFINEEVGFTSFNETFINNIDIQIDDINDPSIQGSNNFLDIKNNSTRTKAFEYIMESNNKAYLKVLFNKYFIALEVIQDNKYCNFEYYENIFINALKVLEENLRDSLKITRYGIRKLNDMFINENSDITDYVKESFFKSDCNELLGLDTDTLISEKKYTFTFENFSTNLYTHVSKGYLNDSIVKRIAFDIDLYSTDTQYLKEIFDCMEEKITSTDEYIFKIFCNLLNEEFLNYYKSEENNYKNLILGVMNNE